MAFRYQVTLMSALLAWGALAFGAVYPWAYWPLAAGTLAMGVWTWRPSRPAPLVWLSLLVLAAVGLQLVPLDAALLQAISPAADRTARGLDLAYAVGVREAHPLSIAPPATARALGFLAFGLVWAAACAAALGRHPAAPKTLARNLAIAGTVLAVIGLAQKATFNGMLLWFWTPQFHANNAFGPFVNRNHFAGWMLLAVAMTIGLLFARIGRISWPPNVSWRERVLWMGSPDAAPILLTAAAALAMSCALMWTMSRSGIAAAAVVLTVMLGAAVRRARAGMQRAVLAGYLVCAIAGVVAWRGADTLVGWYGRTATLEYRIQLWKDTLPAVEEFWLTGAGLNTYSTLMLTVPRTEQKSHPNAAHNDYLQLVLEGGLLVTIPVVLLGAAVGRRVVRGLRAPQDEGAWWVRMGAVAGLCGIAVQEVSEFSLQIPAVALLAATCLAVAAHEPAPPQVRRQSRPRDPSVVAPAA